MRTWAEIRELGTISAAQATYKGARHNVDPLVQQLGELLRPDAGLLLDICRRAGIHRQTLRRWLVGTRTPNVADLRAVLEVLGYTLSIKRIPHEDLE